MQCMQGRARRRRIETLGSHGWRKEEFGGATQPLLFFCQPLSRLAATAPRSGSLLVCVITAQKLSPFTGKVAVSDSERSKGEHIKFAKCRKMFPLSFAYAQQLPRFTVAPLTPSVTACAVPAPSVREPFGRCPNSYVKPPCRGRWILRSKRRMELKLAVPACGDSFWLVVAPKSPFRGFFLCSALF